MNEQQRKKIEELSLIVEQESYIDSNLYANYDVKRGLRNSNGTGVLAGLSKVGEVHGYYVEDGDVMPDHGKLYYRGKNVYDIVDGFQKDKRFGFEEVCYLLLFGKLPTALELNEFSDLLGELRELEDGFVRGMILKAPSTDIMNKLARSVLAKYSYDDNPDDTSTANVIRQSIELIAQFPSIMAYGYQAKSHYHNNESLFLHKPKRELSTAENILTMMRHDSDYSRVEAEILDLSLVLHAEHGGGNNSSFVTRVVTSSGSDTYSAIAAAIGSLKGPKHGGANMKVLAMMNDIKRNVKKWDNKEEIKRYLTKIINKEAFDGSGLIYGMGHAIYTLSDPRAVLLKQKAIELAKEKDKMLELNLYLAIEELTPQVFTEVKGIDKHIAANVDLYSGFVYEILNIPPDIYTPLFATARIPGWCAHRIEELLTGHRIIRPAYKSVVTKHKYRPLSER
ncbi:citrate/2-methylcitrate synthase [Desulfuribacillus alkaliarsenatis]|uniref:Citrate synthase n=1 Tax=Desulfuribacillus alkaliarsenatis TaxID=766136 RepID=A0A1E5G0L1_9FIRM|nr:citrate/2-methylcitrate synthase [Desulfuribacillus alkaliarsenatis]OEF96283.1 citrate synthase [Desulfuribacillus alkaliarsenatis]